MTAERIYFAAEIESRKAVDGTLKRIRRHRQHLRDSGRGMRILRSWRTYYGYGPDGAGETNGMRPSGRQGELVDFTTNDYAALVEQAAVLMTGTKPAFKAIAKTTDFKSHAQAILADQLIEFYERQFNLGELDRRAVQTVLVCSEEWCVLTWDVTKGRDVEVEPNEDGSVSGDASAVVREGDIVVRSLTPFDVAYDPDVKESNERQWVAFQYEVNRFDLKKQLIRRGKLEEAKRLDMESTSEVDLDPDLREFNMRSHGTSVDRDSEKDIVRIWELRHLPTPSVPKGRLIQFRDATCVIYDSVETREDGTVVDHGLPYDELHAYQLCPAFVIGNGTPHTPFFDLCAAQEGLDMVASIQVTAVNAGGISNTWVQTGDQVSVEAYAGGLNIVQSKTKPESLSTVKMDPEAVAFGAAWLDMMRRRVGFNAAALGEPQKGMPASAMALMQSQAVQFHSALQAAFAAYVEAKRTGIIRMLQRYATSKRVAAIAGKSNAWTLKSFSKDDISEIDRIAMEAVDPTMRTVQGRSAMLDWLGQRNLIREPKDAIGFLSTGRIEPVYEFDERNLARIQAEKEMLSQGIGMAPQGPDGRPMPEPGKQYIVLSPLDTPWLDIPEYATVLMAPGARETPEVVQAVATVTQAKLAQWRSMDPAILMLLKGPPPPPIMPPTALGPGAAPAGAPAPGGPSGPPAPHEPPPPGQSHTNVQLPKPPKPPAASGAQQAPMPPPVVA